MTSVTLLQCLTAALAVLLLVEVGTRRDELAHRGWHESSADPGPEFRPDLIVAWDDEAAGVDVRPCTRPVPVHHRRWLRSPRGGAELHVRTR